MNPLVMLHGALGSAAQFADFQNELPDIWQKFAPDFPGHGGRPAADTFSIDGFARFLHNHLEAQGLSTVNFFGYSMGGYVALRFAALFPEKVGAIFTLGTKFDWTPGSAARESAMLDPDKIEAKVPAFAAALAARHAPADWRWVLRQTADMLTALGNGGAMSNREWAQIRCPVVICRAEDDRMVSEAESRQAAAALPDGRFEVLPESKHPFEQVNFVLLARRLEAFFRTV